jgi:hypothetical protein
MRKKRKPIVNGVDTRKNGMKLVPSIHSKTGALEAVHPEHGQDLSAAKLHAEIVKLRVKGHTMDEIAAVVQVSPTEVKRAIQAELQLAREQTFMDVEALREIDVRRLDVALKAIWKEVEEGKETAILTMIRILERRAKLLGHDAPLKAEITPLIPGLTREDVAKMSSEEMSERLRLLLAQARRGELAQMDVLTTAITVQ